MSLTPLNPKGWPPPRGYANGLAGEGRLVILGGQIGWDAQGASPRASFRRCARRCSTSLPC
jgi:enamine deaminase RidA (YjgF/YER057c/UK114 family)